MPAIREVFSCKKCGNQAELLLAGTCVMQCCGEPMQLLEEKTADKSTEKHVPVIEKVPGGYKVTVGSTLHPMTAEHSIQWIEFSDDNGLQRAWLKAGDAPSAFFKSESTQVSAREYCNLHGLWKS